MRVPESYRDKHKEKVCTMCKDKWDINSFYLKKVKVKGRVYFLRSSHCITCHLRRMNAYHQKKREERLQNEVVLVGNKIVPKYEIIQGRLRAKDYGGQPTFDRKNRSKLVSESR